MGHIVRDLSIVKNSCSRQKPYNHDLTTTENTKKKTDINIPQNEMFSMNSLSAIRKSRLKQI